MGRSKKDAVPADYPQGLRTVTFKDLDEDDWWLITNLFKGRIDYFQHRLDEVMRTQDPDLIENQTDWYRDAIERLTTRLTEFENQISSTYFRRLRAEKAARLKQPNS